MTQNWTGSIFNYGQNISLDGPFRRVCTAAYTRICGAVLVAKEKKRKESGEKIKKIETGVPGN
jgi:hypothetical protein